LCDPGTAPVYFNCKLFPDSAFTEIATQLRWWLVVGGGWWWLAVRGWRLVVGVADVGVAFRRDKLLEFIRDLLEHSFVLDCMVRFQIFVLQIGIPDSLSYFPSARKCPPQL
jgi:hypothetical protein